ncbi:MAG: amidohydrolase family protein [Burkholderiaceae bacterium]|nr:amidohydrolase family protein [Burkholderiaceae bacterium]
MNKFTTIAAALALSAGAAWAQQSAPGQSNQVIQPDQASQAKPELLTPEQQLAKLTNRATAKVVYRGATLIAGNGQPARADMAIVVDGERIAAIVPAAQLDAALTKGAEMVDVGSSYVLPGLIDSHVHYATHPDRAYAEAELKRDLYAGITGVRDMAGDARLLGDLSRAAMINELAAPDIFYASLVAGPSFFQDPRTVTSSLGMGPGQAPWMYAVTDKTDIALAVAQARGTGATGLKIYANLPGPLVRKLVAEAKRQHFPVWTHMQVYPATPYDSLGATTVSHVCMIARYVREPNKVQYGHRDEPSYEGLDANDAGIRRYVAALAKSGTILDATLSVYQPAAEIAEKKAAHPHCARELAAAITRAAHAAGVTIIAGTDENATADDPLPQLFRELDMLVHDGGLSPQEAIAAATSNAARALGKDKEFGTLEVGKLANLVFVKNDPLQDVANLRSVMLTVKRGVRYAREDYHHAPIPVHDDI